SLPHLSERPFWTLPGGNLRKFLRGLSQFPLSFLTKSQWVPRSSGEVRSWPRHDSACGTRPSLPAEPRKGKVKRRQVAARPVAFLASLAIRLLEGRFVQPNEPCEASRSRVKNLVDSSQLCIAFPRGYGYPLRRSKKKCLIPSLVFA